MEVIEEEMWEADKEGRVEGGSGVRCWVDGIKDGVWSEWLASWGADVGREWHHAIDDIGAVPGEVTAWMGEVSAKDPVDDVEELRW